ncbi:MAG TPA: hypothetical protein VJ570_03730 [Holophagaceae bacterium]|nr:hypothetical protein [Holophagaceae bacterium]
MLLLPACRFKRQEGPAIYAPWEEGRTLAYEDPSLPTPDQQRTSRFQVRVAQGLLDPTQPGLVKLTESSMQSAPSTYTLRLEDGGVELLGEDGKVISVRLPKGFPDRCAEWGETKGELTIRYRVVGPGAWDNPAHVKNVHDPIGIWLEVTAGEAKGRVLYLRGIGQVEQQVWRGGAWVAVSRLVEMAMTDDRPASK